MKTQSLKKIYINGRFLTQPITGVQRCALELIKALDKYITEHSAEMSQFDFTCLVPPNFQSTSFQKWKNISTQKVGKSSGNLWEQIELPFYSQSGLLLCLCNIGPILSFNQVVIMHDASVFAVPEAYSFMFKLKYRFIMRILGITARLVITDSQFSKSELIKYLKIKQEKITVNTLGSEHILESNADNLVFEKNNLPKKPFILTVGSSSPHKNIGRLISSFAKIDTDIDLIIVGGKYSKVFQKVEEKEEKNIIRLGYVTDAELRALYEKAIFLVIPSYYEGFGFPPLEAMACGCPVISSNRASLPEVGGDAVLYFDPENVQEMSEKISLLISDPSLRESQIKSGYEQVKLFNWKKTAEQFVEIIQRSL